MKKKLFTMMTLLLCAVTGAWADDETILSFSGGTLSGATANYTSNGTLDGANYKLANTDAAGNTSYVELVLTSGTFATGDKISISYKGNKADKKVKPGLFFGTMVESTFIVGETIQAEEVDADNVVHSDNLTVTAAGNGTNILRLTRYSGGTGLFITALSITRETSKTSSDLVIEAGKETIIIPVSGTYTLTKDVDFTTSSTGAISYVSGSDAVATVTPGGLITGVAAGTTTITLTQASDETYLGKSIVFTVNVNEPLAKPSALTLPESTLDFTNAATASTLLNGTWHSDYGRALFDNDGSSNYITYSLVGAYQSVGTQKWITQTGLGASNESWDANGVFKGSAAYNMPTAKRANLGSSRIISLRVKGASKAQLLADTRGTSKYIYIAAYEVSGDPATPAASTIIYNKMSTNSVLGILTLNLDAAKEYVIALTSANDSRLYEMALFYDEAVTLYEPIAAASGKTYATYVTKNAVDFSAVSSEITAYTAESVSASSVTLTQKDNAPAGTPLLVKLSSAGGSTNVPYAASTDAVGTNLLVAGTGASVKSDGTNYVYVLQNGKFMLVEESYATPPTVPVGKAYLSTTSVTAPTLDIDFGGTTGIQSVENSQKVLLDGDFYNLAGQRVAQPTKGLYIVNGKKVVIK